MTHTFPSSALPLPETVYHYDSAVQTLFGEDPVLLNQVMAQGKQVLQAYVRRYHHECILAPNAGHRRLFYLDRMRENLATGAALGYEFSRN